MVCWRSVKCLCNCLDISFLLMVRNYWLRYQFGHEWPNTTRVSVFFLSSNKDFPGVWKMSAQIWWPTLSGNLGCHQNVSHQQISGHSRISGIRATGISPFQIFDLNQGCGHSSYGTARLSTTSMNNCNKLHCTAISLQCNITTLHFTTLILTIPHCNVTYAVCRANWEILAKSFKSLPKPWKLRSRLG